MGKRKAPGVGFNRACGLKGRRRGIASVLGSIDEEQLLAFQQAFLSEAPPVPYCYARECGKSENVNLEAALAVAEERLCQPSVIYMPASLRDDLRNFAHDPYAGSKRWLFSGTWRWVYCGRKLRKVETRRGRKVWW